MKTLVFYLNDGIELKKKLKEKSSKGGDKFSAVQADAWDGQRMGADAIDFAHELPRHIRASIDEKWARVASQARTAAQPRTEHGDVVTGAQRQDGPTVEEWVKSGYLAANYPPQGYASRSTKEEIDAAIATQGEVPPAKKPDAKPLEIDLHGLTNAALRGYAESRGIDLGVARTKEEMIQAIETSGKKGV